MRVRFGLGLLIAIAATACNGNGSPDVVDAAMGDVVRTDSVDIVQDVGTDVSAPCVPNSQLPPTATGDYFSTCTTTTDCPSGLTCFPNTQGYPGGMCSMPCGSDAQCSPMATSVASVCRMDQAAGMRICVRECLDGFDCGSNGFTCVKAAAGDNTGLCVPSCTDANCGAGARCNEWTGLCQAMTATYPPAGADDGQPCTGNADCRSNQCITATSTTGAATGWTHGYCASNCALTAGWTSNGLFGGGVDGGICQTFPQSNCPTGSVCFPAGNSYDLAEDGPGQCFAGCMQDTDCRASEGYYCRRTFGLVRLHPDHTTYTVPHTWDNGICEPVDCLNDTTHHCPSGYTCQTVTSATSGTFGICVSGTPPTDAGPADTGTPDTGTPDTGTPDTGTTPDSGTTMDAGSDTSTG